jgi:hypothetical protein
LLQEIIPACVFPVAGEINDQSLANITSPKYNNKTSETLTKLNHSKSMKIPNSAHSIGGIVCAGVILLLAAGASAQRVAFFDNSAPITGNWVTFGSGNAVIDGAETTATYGQTFTAPSVRPSNRRTYLDEWTFYLQQVPAELGGLGTEQSFEFFVMAWDASTGTATGPILYHSRRQTVGADVTAYTPFTIYPEDLALTPGAQYVIFINVSLERNDSDPMGSSIEMAGNGSGGLFPPPYSTSPLSGQFVYQYTAGEFNSVEKLDAALTTQAWATWAVDEYTVYDAVFSDEETHHRHRH